MDYTEVDYKPFSQRHPGFRKGFGMFILIAASITFYFALDRFDSVKAAMHSAGHVFSPIFAGICFAFLLTPIVALLEKLFAKIHAKRISAPMTKKQKGAARGFSILITIILVLLCIWLLLKFTLPDVFDSLNNMMKTFPGLADDFQKAANKKLAAYNVSLNLSQLLSQAINYATNWVKTDLVSNITKYASGIAGFFKQLIAFVINLVVAIACSIYLMYNRETFIGQIKKMTYSNHEARKAAMLTRFTKESVVILQKSIIGKIIDSIIVGLLCYLVTFLCHIPYAVLVSVIVGVTNVVPFFGPWIGAIIAGLIVLIVSPMQAFWLIVIIVCIQQLDMNYLTPKIVGDSVGLPAFWALVSCLIGQGIAGFWGLILGIPVCAIIYQLIAVWDKCKLESRGLPVSTADYMLSSEELAEKYSDEKDMKGNDNAADESEHAEKAAGNKRTGTAKTAEQPKKRK